MSSLEHHLLLEHAKAGMKLARVLLDPKGQILMVQGTELSDAAIVALHRRGVTELWVHDIGSQTVGLQAQEAVLRQHHRERLARLFRRVGEGADDRYLLEIMTQYRGVEPS